ncbi:MAG: peptidoglycan bridge formation glycyltransferase FemA/FemB family protein [Microgenomates group bacterium]
MIDKAFQNSLAQHPLQTWEWGEARTQMGIAVEKIVGNDAIFQMTFHPIPHTSYTIGYLPRSVAPDKDTALRLVEVAKKHNCIFIKMEPYLSFAEGEQLPLIDPAIRVSPHPLFTEWTQTLDITPSEEALLKAMKPKTRYNIRLAEKKGVTVKLMDTDEGFSIFSKLYFETCKRQHYHGHTLEYHRKIWDSMKESQAHILISYYEDTPLGAYELFHFKDRLYYVYGGSSLEHKQVMAPNLLMWETIKLAKKWGAKTFDMWGSLSPDYPPTHAWAGFTRFKEGYGTEFTHLSRSFDLVIKPFHYSIYSLVHAVREKLL